MNKKELSKIPRPSPIPTSEKHGAMKFVTTEELETSDGHVLVLNVFRQKKGDSDIVPEQRTFFTEDDYITQDLSTPKTKWKTAAFHNDFDFGKSTKQFVSMDDYKRFRRFLKGYRYEPRSWKPNPDIWDDCSVYQERVMAKRLKDRHQAEKDAIDARMAVLGDIPEEFFEWVKDDALRKSQYIFFRPQEKSRNMIWCTCSVCGQTFVADKRIIGAKNKEKGECQKCASPITFRSYGIFPSKHTDSIYATYVERLPVGFCLRYFLAERKYKKDSLGIHRLPDKYLEVTREFIRYAANGIAISKGFQWDFFKNEKTRRWCHERERSSMYGGTTLFNCYVSCLYPGNLPEAWEHTPMQWSALEILSRATPGNPARYWDVIESPGSYRALEILAKAGFHNMAHELIETGRGTWGGGNGVNEQGTDLGSVLQLDKKEHPNRENIRTLRQINARIRHLVLMQYIDGMEISIKPDVLVRFDNIFGINRNLLDPTNRNATIHKICRYIERQHDRNKRKSAQSIGRDWLEYIEWCRELGVNLNDDFHYFPPVFYKEHDRVAADYKAHEDEIEAEKKRRNEIMAKNRMELVREFMEDIFSRNDGEEAFMVRGKGLILLVPKDANEIKAEGEALHHCVGAYINRVAKGETSIFFVRKAKEPEIPYFTMEFKDGKVAQCRGKRNCDMPQEVEAFTKVFEQKMKEALKEKEVMLHAG